MPAVVQHLSGLVDSFDVASAGEMRVALDTPMPADRVSFAGPGKTPAELSQAVAAGVTIELESETEATRVVGDRRAARRSGRASPCASIPTSRSRARGCGWAAARSSSASTPSGCPTCSPTLAGADLELLGFHIFAGSQNLNAEILCEAQRTTVELALRLAEASPDAGPLPEHRRRLRHPVLRARRAARSRRDRREPRRPDGGRDPPEPPGRARGRRARSLHRRRVRDLRDPDRRSQGVARQDLPGRRRRAAPSARRVRQLRPGDPPQLSGRDRRPRRRAPTRDRHASSAASARRSTCSPTTSRCPRAEIGDLVVIFQAGAYGLTASPTAFLGHPAPVEVLV